jgi:DNA-binding NarL/FixJ family response regulator
MLSRDSDHEPLMLTEQERAMLAASARGLHVSEVAEMLGHSPETVRRVLTVAMQKLGARSKLEAVVIALRQELIDPST